MSTLSISVRDLGTDTRIVSLAGRLDAKTFGRVDEAVEQARTDGVRRLVVDLAALDYLSAAGAGAFLTAKAAMAEAGGGFALAHASGEVRENLEMLGLDTEFMFADTAEEALNALPP